MSDNVPTLFKLCCLVLIRHGATVVYASLPSEVRWMVQKYAHSYLEFMRDWIDSEAPSVTIPIPILKYTNATQRFQAVFFDNLTTIVIRELQVDNVRILLAERYYIVSLDGKDRSKDNSIKSDRKSVV